MARELIIFLSSPGDVGQERAVAGRVIERLQGEFGQRVALRAFFWENDVVRATATPQAQFIKPSEADICVCILWSRLGTRLPPDFERRADGSIYDSGTAFEFEDAKRAYDEHGSPALLVYRKTAEPLASFRDRRQVQERVDQMDRLEAFFRRWFFNDDGSLKGGYTEFADPDEFERRLYSHLRQLVDEHAQSSDSDAHEEATWHKGSPFRGLETFEYEHAAVFFGRTRAIGEVRERLLRQSADGTAFVFVLGMSGSGKSSLVRAGVIPTITYPGVVEGVDFWRWTALRFGDCRGDMFEWLAGRLVAKDVLPELIEAGATVQGLADTMRRDPESILLPLQMALAHAVQNERRRRGLARDPVGRLLLFVDQFEELYSLPTIDTATRATIARLLLVLARARASKDGGDLSWIVVTMRSDFYHRLSDTPSLVEVCNGNGDYHVLAPRRIEISDMIRQPARAAGLRFEVDSHGWSLDAEIEEAATEDASMLPLLEFVLDELYKRRRDERLLTFEAYRDLGGLEGALAHRAEQVFGAQPPDVQSGLPGVLRALANIRDGEDASLTAKPSKLASFPSGSPERALVEAFLSAEARLLVADGRGADAHVRVAHEALLSHWPRARDLITNDRENLRTRARVDAATAQWLSRNRSGDFLLPPGGPLGEAVSLLGEWRANLNATTIDFIEASIASERQARERRLRRARSIASAMSVLAVAAAGLGVWAYSERGKAVASAEAARKHQEAALTAANTLVADLAKPLQQGSGVSISEVRQMLGRAEEIYGGLVTDGGKNREIRYGQAVMLLASAEVHGALKNNDARLARATEAKAVLERLIGEEPKNETWLRELGRSEIAVGDARRARNELMDAQQAYRNAQTLREGLAKRLPEALAYRRDLAVAHERLGDIARDRGQATESLNEFRTALGILEDLPKTPDLDTDLQRIVAVLYNKVGDMQLDQDDAAGALASHSAAWSSIRRLLETNPRNTLWRLDLAQTYGKIGGDRLAQRDYLAAAENATASVQILEGLHQIDPANAGWRRELIVAENQLGDVLAESGNLAHAADTYTRALRLIEGAGDAQNWRRERSVTLDRLGDVRRAQGDVRNAQQAYRESLAIAEGLVSADPENLPRRYDLLTLHAKMARAAVADGNPTQAKRSFERAAQEGEELLRRNSINGKWRSDICAVLNDYAWLLATARVQAVRDPKKAVQLAERASALTERRQPAFLDTLAMAHFSDGAVESAIAVGREAMSLQSAVTLTPEDWAEIKGHLDLFERAAKRRPSE